MAPALAPLHACSNPTCARLTSRRYCVECAVLYPERIPDRVSKRPSPSARGYNDEWREYSRQYLIAHPLCRECEKTGRAEPAKCVDHIVPHKGDWELFWNDENHQPLCLSCHGRKSATEQRGRAHRAFDPFAEPPHRPRQLSGTASSRTETSGVWTDRGSKSLQVIGGLTASPASAISADVMTGDKT